MRSDQVHSQSSTTNGQVVATVVDIHSHMFAGSSVQFRFLGILQLCSNLPCVVFQSAFMNVFQNYSLNTIVSYSALNRGTISPWRSDYIGYTDDDAFM